MSTPTPHQPPNSMPFSPAAPTWSDPQRQTHFNHWLAALKDRFGLLPESVSSASADASFRRYFRVQSANGPLIIMDAPPDKEDCKPFVHVAGLLHTAHIRAPDILDWDATHGFMLLSDLGTHTMMQVMDQTAPPPLDLYLQAVDILVRWQLASRPGELPAYDHALLKREIDLFPQWYVGTHRQLTLSAAQQKVVDDAFALILKENLSWPSVYVHRDFMPRNLMWSDGEMGVLDFQDAVYGPVTYDIASLMRDAFLSWEEDFCLDVTVRYWEKARKAGLPVGDDFGAFYRGVEWMGLQRHLKIAGIFARLTLRDGKPQYLADTPRFIGYIRSACDRYRALGPLLKVIDTLEGIETPTGIVFGRA